MSVFITGLEPVDKRTQDSKTEINCLQLRGDCMGMSVDNFSWGFVLVLPLLNVCLSWISFLRGQ